MTAVARRHIPGATARELVLLLAGVGLVVVGVLPPRDAAIIGVGVSLLLATPAVGPRDDDGPDEPEASS